MYTKSDAGSLTSPTQLPSVDANSAVDSQILNIDELTNFPTPMKCHGSIDEMSDGVHSPQACSVSSPSDNEFGWDQWDEKFTELDLFPQLSC